MVIVPAAEMGHLKQCCRSSHDIRYSCQDTLRGRTAAAAVEQSQQQLLSTDHPNPVQRCWRHHSISVHPTPSPESLLKAPAITGGMTFALPLSHLAHSEALAIHKNNLCTDKCPPQEGGLTLSHNSSLFYLSQNQGKKSYGVFTLLATALFTHLLVISNTVFMSLAFLGSLDTPKTSPP